MGVEARWQGLAGEFRHEVVLVRAAKRTSTPRSSLDCAMNKAILSCLVFLPHELAMQEQVVRQEQEPLAEAAVPSQNPGRSLSQRGAAAVSKCVDLPISQRAAAGEGRKQSLLMEHSFGRWQKIQRGRTGRCQSQPWAGPPAWEDAPC